MHRPSLAQDDMRVQEGLDLLKAYMDIRDPRVRQQILAWVMDVRAGERPGCGPTTSSKSRSADESGAERAG